MEWLNYVYPVMGIGALMGLLFFAFRSGLNTMQQQAIAALKDRLDAQDKRIIELEKENAIQAHEMDLMKSAFETIGVTISIKGDVITMFNKDGSSTIIKPGQAAPPPPKKPKTKITKAVSTTTESEQA